MKKMKHLQSCLEKVILEKKYKIYYSYKFSKKVYQIYDYILEELQNPIAAYHFQIKIRQTISILEYFPNAGPKYKTTSYRYLVMKNWLIFYKIQNNIIKIYNIFNSKQNLFMLE